MSRRCQWAGGGGGTCPMALLQVTLLAWRHGTDCPRGLFQPGRAVGVSWLLPWCLDRPEGSWTPGGELGLAHRSGRGGAGLRGQTCLAAVSSWFEAPGRELLVRAPGGWAGQREVRRGGSAVSVLPRSPWCRGAPLNSIIPSWYLPASCSTGGRRALSHPPCECAVPPLPSLSFSGPIARGICAPLGSSLPGPIDSVLRQPGRLSENREKERERPRGWDKLRAAADALPSEAGEEEPGRGKNPESCAGRRG